jgi:hypothetical protein
MLATNGVVEKAAACERTVPTKGEAAAKYSGVADNPCKSMSA